MFAKEIREKYLRFFESKGHTIIPSASIMPENDPSTLFTGSGMQPMVSYLLGEEHPAGTRLTDSQKSFRTGDIEDVGDNRHTTFFEMLGNWSLGDYFKKEQIEWMFEFLTKELKLDPNRIYISVFRGDKKIGISQDKEAVEFWQERFKSVGIDALAVDMAEKKGMRGGRIFYYDEKENWWSRSGTPDNMPVGEPGGPDSEMFWDFGADLKIHENSSYKNQPCHPACDCGRFLEIGNNVFMEYVKTESGFQPLEKKNIDFGGGLERLAAAVLDNPDVFMGDLFKEIRLKLEELSGRKYDESSEVTNSFRIVMDHLRGATFIIGDNKGVTPSNTDQGYIVRRLIRRAIRYGKQLGIEKDNWTKEIAEVVINEYKDVYSELEKNKDFILEQLDKEEIQFSKTLEKGLRELGKGIDPFVLFTTYGFPIEMTQEIAEEKGIKVNLKDFEKKMKKHQELSRTASVGKFKGGLADSSEETISLHTTAHLLLAALRKVLGEDVQQKGSNITPERLRFDFSYGEKLTDEQKIEVERLVNEAIQKDLPVICEEISLNEAKKNGAVGAFDEKYGERVKVYKITEGDDIFSYEICGGPHIEKIGELGKFKITKEQSSSAGVRRIKAVLNFE
ncbi:MAG: alanine--tRNA ligase [Patescibacteria group bacterium]|nr:alanine--tRNA ligase [Patescibacteria group bacterium]